MSTLALHVKITVFSKVDMSLSIIAEFPSFLVGPSAATWRDAYNVARRRFV